MLQQGNLLDILLILLLVCSPIVIFFTARKAMEWIIGLLLFAVLLLYYAYSIVSFITSRHVTLGFFVWLSRLLISYREFILNHWPQIFGMHVDYSFPTTWWPIGILYAGGILRLFVEKFVPHSRLRSITHEYWLYIASFLIFLLVISSILDWNFLIAGLVFVLVLLMVVAGLHRIVGDIFIAIFHLSIYIMREVWIAMKYAAFVAAKVAKFLNNMLKAIKELYDEYIREPFRLLNERIRRNQGRRLEGITKRLNQEGIDKNDYQGYESSLIFGDPVKPLWEKNKGKSLKRRG
jgi:hypothetical protein